MLIANKPVSVEGLDAVWDEVRDQLFRYMAEARAAKPPSKTPLYGIVTVGHYSRYYTLSRHATALSKFESARIGYNGEPLHFKYHERWVNTLLEEIAQLASEL